MEQVLVLISVSKNQVRELLSYLRLILPMEIRHPNTCQFLPEASLSVTDYGKDDRR
jgi:hypothetical protein